MEDGMRLDHNEGHEKARLRLVYPTGVVAFDIAPGTTYGDVARMCGAPGNRRLDSVVSLDVTIGRRRFGDRAASPAR